MAYRVDPTQHHDSQAFQLQHHFPRYDQSANSYAFDANSHLPPANTYSNTYSGPRLASPLSHGNGRPEIFPMTSSYPPNMFPAHSTETTTQGLLAAAPTAKPDPSPQVSAREPESPKTSGDINGSRLAAHDRNSDMEDGELSEDADRRSAAAHFPTERESISHPSLTVNGTTTTRNPEDDGFRQGETAVHQRNGVGTLAMKGELKHRPNNRLPNQDLSPTNRKEHEMSLYASQDRARQAVDQLQRHGIGYAQLLEEHIHPDLLRNLYLELAKRTHDTISSSKLPTQIMQTHPLPKRLPEPTFNQQATDTPIHLSVHEVSGTKSSMNAETRKMPEARQLGKPEVKNPGTQPPATSEGPELQENSAHQQSSRVAVGEPAIKNGHTLHANDDSSRKTSKNAPSTNEKLLATIADNKSLAKPTAAPKSLQPSVIHPAVKPPIPKAAVKPVDRKDYIARLQAAKAGKVAPTMTASQPGPARQKTPQASSPKVTSQLGVANSSMDVLSSGSVPAQITGSAGSSVTTVPFPNSAVEAKKREQTELARRKIEELRNRSNVPKESQSASNEPSLTVASTNQQSDPAKHSVEMQPNPVSIKATNPDIAPATPQHSYFPFRNGAFSLPGLFMSTSSERDEAETPKIASTQDGFRDIREAEPTVARTLVADQSLSQSFPASQNLVPSSQAEQSPESTTASLVTQTQAISNPRKRPTAADFIDSVPSKIQRSYSYKADSSVVFEVSDDEADDLENESSDVEMSGNPDMKTLQPRQVVASHPATPDDLKSRQQLGLNDLHGKAEKLTSKLNMAQPSPQTPNKKDVDSLRAREEEIERMNRKIIEMEQRRKMRQDVSRTQTPGTSGRPTPFLKPNESNLNVLVTPDDTKQLSELNGQATLPSRGFEDGPNDQAAASGVITVEPQGGTPEQNGDLQTPVEYAATPVTNSDEQQLQRRKTEIEGNLSSANAAVEDLRARLEILHQDELELQTQIQKQVDSKRAFQEELAKLLRKSTSSPPLPSQGDEETVELQRGADSQQSVPNMSLEQAQEDDQVPAAEQTNISNEARTENGVTEKPEKGPVSESALPTEAPSNQSLVSGELAEDVMDISGSEEEGDVTEHLPGSSTRAGHGVAESDSEEPYEPPSSFGGMEDVSNPVTDSSKQQQPLTNERLQQHDHLEATNDASLAMDDSAATDVHVAAEEQLHSVPRPGHAQTPLDSSDSDDYEPPEPMASVDLASLTSDTAAAVAEPSFSPADANDTLQANPVSPDALPAVIDQVDVEREASVQSASEQTRSLHGNDKHGYFVPYESPLQQFHAYRYHPDFVSSIGSGYRSLTYSHNIDARKPICPFEIGGRCNDASCDNQHFSSMNLSDDMILVQMGAIPEGLSQEQQSAFVGGLRETIQEIRVRKVKDFKTVASEIAAYRARFLGDSSKILPL
ncbi:MAG: hypothetical protein L6R36_003711 [Xanthoria steineri]|nr:MAG: hypothetical protein L6R36_003711 [Xanthoria steineri]